MGKYTGTPLLMVQSRWWAIDGDLFSASLPNPEHLIIFNQLLRSEEFVLKMRERFYSSGDPPDTIIWPCLSTLRESDSGGVREFCYTNCALNSPKYSSQVIRQLGCWKEEQFWSFEDKEFPIDNALGGGVLSFQNEKTPMPWRPMLIPLTHGGKRDMRAKEDNPDGSLVQGGSFLLNGKPFPACMEEKNPFALSDSEREEQFSVYAQSLCFSDTRDNGLKWVWVDGCLLSIEVLCDVPIKLLAEQGMALSNQKL